MNTALVISTINVPSVLEIYRAILPTDAVRFFVVGDQQSDDLETQKCVDALGNAEYFSYARQQTLGWATNSVLPPRCIQRRNIGFLEALKWGADVIVSADDDNTPLNEFYFDQHQRIGGTFTGLLFVGNAGAWFDAGTLLHPESKHRGIPHNAPTKGNIRHAVGAKLGVSAGLCLGDPDIDAVTRISNHPTVSDASAVGGAGIAVDPNTWTVFNSQNTSVLRQFIPAWGMVPFVGRFDDIYASMVVQRVMRDRGYHVHFGKPFVWQTRNEHDLLKDLRGEIDGYATIKPFAALLDQIMLPNHSVVTDCRIIWDVVRAAAILPLETAPAMYAWLADCEQVLK